MAPRETKETPKVQRVITKTNTVKKPISVPSASVIKRTTSRKIIQETPRKVNNMMMDTRQRTNSVSKVLATPKPKEEKPAACPGSVTKSAKKSWKRRPKPAHSGVPVPEKMKRILQQQLQDSDCSL